MLYGVNRSPLIATASPRRIPLDTCRPSINWATVGEHCRIRLQPRVFQNAACS